MLNSAGRIFLLILSVAGLLASASILTTPSARTAALAMIASASR